MARPRAAAIPSLDQVWRDLESWGRARRRGDRIPEVLWQASAALAREHGVGRISRALRLEHYALQRRVTPVEAGSTGSRAGGVSGVLWQAAAALAREHGVGRISRALREARR